MRLNGITNKSIGWKAISHSEIDEGELKIFEKYFDLKKNIPDFPFVLFSDHIPADDELTDTMNSSQSYLKKIRPFIVALKRKDFKNFSGCWRLLESGIDDVVEWDETEEIINYLEAKHRRSTVIKETLSSPLITENLVGISIAWKNFLSDIIEATLFSQNSILLIGDSGTGKELVSRLIHSLDKRSGKKKLIIVDCTTIVPELSGSELFGHEKGSYTSAVQSREGAFALANEGSLFLDEVGELPMTLQAELLRVLQEGTYKKVGSNTWQKTNFRLICATNRDLRTAMNEGRFRQDLYYRIADCEYRLPSLNERKEDVPALVNYFLAKQFPENNCPVVDKPIMDYLVQREYPGNVRELKQLVHRIILKHVDHKRITIGEIPADDRNAFRVEKLNGNNSNMESFIRKALLTGENWWDLKNKISETAIQVALDLEGNNKLKAAERLGVDVRTVQQYVKKKI